MHPSLKRLCAAILVFLAALSLLFTLIFIVMTWRVQRNLTDSLGNLYDQLSLTLDTTSQGLSVMSSTLTSTSESLFQLQNTMLSMAQSVHDASLRAESVSVLVGEDLPTMILSAQTSLASAQASANVIDDVLITLSKIPFIGVDYDPDVPLSTSLINIAYSLSLLTDSLETIQTNLDTTGKNLSQLESDLTEFSLDLTKITNDLSAAQEVILAYQSQIDHFKEQLVSGNQSLPTWTTAVAVMITFILSWIAVPQAWILVRGIQLIRKPE